MLFDDLVAKAQATYATLKQQARERYPVGHYYAMAGGRIVADDATEQGVRQQVRALGLSDDRIMIEQVLGNVIECNLFPGWIMFMAMSEHLIRVMTPNEEAEE